MNEETRVTVRGELIVANRFEARDTRSYPALYFFLPVQHQLQCIISINLIFLFYSCITIIEISRD